MELLKVDPLHPDPVVIAHAARVLRAGGLVAFPTETVYGLGANALDAKAVARIYEAKGRPAWNPVIAHVATVADAHALTSAWSPDATRLADAFWPGPLTLVLPRSKIVPDIATAGLNAIAIRIPNHPVALALLRAAGRPIAATRSGQWFGKELKTEIGAGLRYDAINDIALSHTVKRTFINAVKVLFIM